MTDFLKFSFLILISVYSFKVDAQECTALSVDSLKRNLHMANQGRIQDAIDQKNRAAACYESGSLQGFVRSSKITTSTSGCIKKGVNPVKEIASCDKKIEQIETICKGQESDSRKFFQDLSRSYFEAVDCLENMTGGFLAPANIAPVKAAQ